MGRAIGELRREKGMTQEELSQRVKLHESYISFIESGPSHIRTSLQLGLFIEATQKTRGLVHVPNVPGVRWMGSRSMRVIDLEMIKVGDNSKKPGSPTIGPQILRGSFGQGWLWLGSDKTHCNGRALSTIGLQGTRHASSVSTLVPTPFSRANAHRQANALWLLRPGARLPQGRSGCPLDRSR